MSYYAGMIWVLGAVWFASESISQEFQGGVALVAIVGGVVAAIFTAKTRTERDALRNQIQIAEGAADAWKLERDAEIAKADRLAQDLRVESAARTAAEARTDITRLEGQAVANHTEIITILNSLKGPLEEIARNTKPPVETHAT